MIFLCFLKRINRILWIVYGIKLLLRLNTLALVLGTTFQAASGNAATLGVCGTIYEQCAGDQDYVVSSCSCSCADVRILRAILKIGSKLLHYGALLHLLKPILLTMS
jgi:hypothetical protein